MGFSKKDIVLYNGTLLTLKEWADYAGIKYPSLWARLQRMPFVEAVEFAPHSPLCTVDGCLRHAQYNEKTLCNTHHYRIRRNGTLKLKAVSDEDRFWAATTKGDGCWMFSQTGSHPYGAMQWSGSRMLAHRVSWIIHRGPIPDGLYVCHSCDTPGCVNPDHLWLGDNAANMRDMAEKGRSKRGEQHPKAKLTKADVLAIRESGDTQRSLASAYGVGHSTIWQIKRGGIWSWL